MPVNEKSYENGKIYRIWSLDTDKIYIGNTCDTLSNRFCFHKYAYKYWKNGNGVYTSVFNLFDLVGVDNCKIELEHNFACESKTKLNREEGRIQRLYKDIIVNERESGRTLKESKKIHRQNHKEEIKEYMKNYDIKHNCECGGKYSMRHKARHFKTTKHLNYINNIQGFQTQTQNS
jgi:hypothetical protein